MFFASPKLLIAFIYASILPYIIKKSRKMKFEIVVKEIVKGKEVLCQMPLTYFVPRPGNSDCDPRILDVDKERGTIWRER